MVWANCTIMLGNWSYEDLSKEERICPVCNANTVEAEYHAIISCQVYDDIREELFTCAMSCNDDFYHMSNNDRFIL